MRILIVSGGKLNMDYVHFYLEGCSYDHIIAVDRGLAYCQALGLKPTEILGDFDSLEDTDLVRRYEEDGVPVNRFPSHKDYSDTELAVQMAIDLAEKAEGEKLEDTKSIHVTMLASTGTRYDHSLANIGLLERFCQAGIDAVIIDDHNEIRMVAAQGEKTAVVVRRDDNPCSDGSYYYSLIPWGGDVKGVTLQGFAYPLEDHTIKASESLCISNELKGDAGVIEFASGKLLIIKAWD